MVVSVLKTPGANCFLGNPICFQFRSEAYGQIDVSVSFQGETFTQSYYPFKKAGYYYYTFDISSFLYREYTSDSFKQGVEMISELSDFSIPFSVRIEKVIFDPATSLPTDFVFNGTAFAGGVNDQQFEAFAENGLDIFSYRLDNPDKQYLFTTRSHSKTVRLKDTELYPFVFIHSGKDIVFRSESGNEITTLAKTKGTVCLLDVYKIRDKFAFDFNEQTSKIDVLTGHSLRTVPSAIVLEIYDESLVGTSKVVSL